jgi:hypothetical protein
VIYEEVEIDTYMEDTLRIFSAHGGGGGEGVRRLDTCHSVLVLGK